MHSNPAHSPLQGSANKKSSRQGSQERELRAEQSAGTPQLASHPQFLPALSGDAAASQPAAWHVKAGHSIEPCAGEMPKSEPALVEDKIFLKPGSPEAAKELAAGHSALQPESLVWGFQPESEVFADCVSAENMPDVEMLKLCSIAAREPASRIMPNPASTTLLRRCLKVHRECMICRLCTAGAGFGS